MRHFKSSVLSKLSTCFVQIKEDIRTFKSEGVQMDAKRQAMLKELEERQTRASKEAEGYNKRNKEINKILDQAKAGRDLFKDTLY